MELERRHWEIDSFEIRGHGAERTVRGLGVPFDKLSEDLGGFRERILPGATTDSLKRGDIVLLWQHDAAQPISRQNATRNALVLEERKNGVFFEQNAASFTERMLDLINDGVVRQMSFGFRMLEETWDETKKIVIRELHKIDLRELSPVTFPAYNSTALAVRSAAAAGIVLRGERPVPSQGSAKAQRDHLRRRIDLVTVGVGSDVPVLDLDQARREHEERVRQLGAIGVPKAPTVRRKVREFPSESQWRTIRVDERYKLRSYAYHEAGHAVACAVAGIPLESVYLYSSRRAHDGRWRLSGGKCQWRHLPRGDRRVTASLFMAGRAAEQVLGVNHHDLASTTGDEARARELSTSHRGIAEDVARAEAMLRRNWPAVKAIASKLIQDQRLDGQAAEAIILENLDQLTRDRVRARRKAA